jgi:peptidoglycan/LPS O-acetylase OafA/YrhL
MSPATSVVLDLLRFFLALVVAFGHFTIGSIQDGWPDLTRFSLVAVGGFFVLSGYIIRMITLRVDDPAAVRKYFVERAARLVSITWPALVVTAVCMAVALHVAPDFVERIWFHNADNGALRYALNAVLYTQPYGLDLAPQGNDPLWSLGYEAGFYVFWGAMLADKVHRRGPWLTLLALIVYGPHVVILFPCWLLGVLLYDQTSRASERSAALRLALLGAAGSLACGLALVLLHAQLTALWHGTVIAGIEALGMDRGRLAMSYVIGAVVCYVALLTVLPALKLIEPRWSPRPSIVRWSRHIGEATFPLYAIHAPLILLAAALAVYERGSALQKLTVLGAIIALSFALVPLGNQLKRSLSGYFRAA